MSTNGIEHKIETAVVDCGLVLHGIIHTKSGITIYIKRKNDAVSIKDCEAVISQLGYMTDIEDLHIEVESSGYAPLLKPEHYEERISQHLKIQTKDKTLKAKLLSVENQGITVLHNSESIEIKWDQINRSTPHYLE